MKLTRGAAGPPMDCRVFLTAHGEIPVWGSLDQFRPGRPALFVIRGAFATLTMFDGLPGHFPHADVALVHLPGMHTPTIPDMSVEGFARAFEAAIAQVFPGRPVNVLGMSVGGVVALDVHEARAIVAIDPPLSTRAAWPLHADMARRAQAEPQFADWIWSILGIAPDGRLAERDYGRFLDRLERRACVIVGGEPLEPQRPLPASGMPSLVSAEDRKRLAEHPLVKLLVAEGAGHHVPRDNPRPLLSVLDAVLAPGGAAS